MANCNCLAISIILVLGCLDCFTSASHHVENAPTEKNLDIVVYQGIGKHNPVHSSSYTHRQNPKNKRLNALLAPKTETNYHSHRHNRNNHNGNQHQSIHSRHHRTPSRHRRHHTSLSTRTSMSSADSSLSNERIIFEIDMGHPPVHLPSSFKKSSSSSGPEFYSTGSTSASGSSEDEKLKRRLMKYKDDMSKKLQDSLQRRRKLKASKRIHRRHRHKDFWPVAHGNVLILPPSPKHISYPVNHDDSHDHCSHHPHCQTGFSKFISPPIDIPKGLRRYPSHF